MKSILKKTIILIFVYLIILVTVTLYAKAKAETKTFIGTEDLNPSSTRSHINIFAARKNETIIKVSRMLSIHDPRQTKPQDYGHRNPRVFMARFSFDQKNNDQKRIN